MLKAAIDSHNPILLKIELFLPVYIVIELTSIELKSILRHKARPLSPAILLA